MRFPGAAAPRGTRSSASASPIATASWARILGARGFLITAILDASHDQSLRTHRQRCSPHCASGPTLPGGACHVQVAEEAQHARAPRPVERPGSSRRRPRTGRSGLPNHARLRRRQARSGLVRHRAMLHACDCGAAPRRDVGLRFCRSRHGRQTGLLRSPSRIARSHNPLHPRPDCFAKPRGDAEWSRSALSPGPPPPASFLGRTTDPLTLSVRFGG